MLDGGVESCSIWRGCRLLLLIFIGFWCLSVLLLSWYGGRTCQLVYNVVVVLSETCMLYRPCRWSMIWRYFRFSVWYCRELLCLILCISWRGLLRYHFRKFFRGRMYRSILYLFRSAFLFLFRAYRVWALWWWVRILFWWWLIVCFMIYRRR